MERRIKVSNENVKIIENASRDDVRPGDHVTWEYTNTRNGVTTFERREGIAHHRDEDGDWCTKEGRYITYRESNDSVITIRRTVQDLPTTPGIPIVANDGHEYIEAVFSGVVWRTSEAVLGLAGLWHGVWRAGRSVVGSVSPELITPGTWKVDDR